MKRRPPLLDTPVVTHRPLSEEEAALFLQAMVGKTSSAPSVPKKKPVAAAPLAAKKKLPQPTALPLLDKMEQTRLTSGRTAIEATLDLHGMTLEEAYGALLRFTESLAGRGVRMALVITGKGKTEEGTLRSLLPRWLNEPPLRGRIIAYDKAGPRHGGSGAWYLRIRKQK